MASMPCDPVTDKSILNCGTALVNRTFKYFPPNSFRIMWPSHWYSVSDSLNHSSLFPSGSSPFVSFCHFSLYALKLLSKKWNPVIFHLKSWHSKRCMHKQFPLCMTNICSDSIFLFPTVCNHFCNTNIKRQRCICSPVQYLSVWLPTKRQRSKVL